LSKQGQPLVLDKKTLMIGGGAALLLLILVVLLMRRRDAPAVEATASAALPAPTSAAPAQIAAQPGSELERQLEAKLAEREAQQQKLDAQALSALKLAPAITKTSEVLAKHLREKIKEEAGLSAHVLQSWIREDGNY